MRIELIAQNAKFPFMPKGIIILGSSRSKGETFQLCQYISSKLGYPILDLKSKSIAEFDYENNYPDHDEFKEIIQDIGDNYDQLIIASPVYWYTMSGIMKTFFDRISDCLKYDKETGRKLRGKSMGVVSCSSPDLVDGHYMPYRESANYLGIDYLAEVHGYIENGEISLEVKTKLDQFIEKLG